MKVVDLLNARDKMGLEERKLESREEKEIRNEMFKERQQAEREAQNDFQNMTTQQRMDLMAESQQLDRQSYALRERIAEANMANDEVEKKILNAKLDEINAKNTAIAKLADGQPLTESEQILINPSYITKKMQADADKIKADVEAAKSVDAAVQGMVNANQLDKGKYEAGLGARQILESRAGDSGTKYGHWDGSKWTPVNLSDIHPSLNIGEVKRRASAKQVSVDEYIQALLDAKGK